MNSDFWAGVRLVVNGLADAAKKASYCLGFGSGGLGVALVIVAKLGISGPAALLISMSAFFILARLGKAVDAYAERAHLRDRRRSDRGELLVPGRHLQELEDRIEELERR